MPNKVIYEDVVCDQCGRMYNRRKSYDPRKKHKYCSKACYKLARGWEGPFTGVCEHCGRTFVSRIKGKLFCGIGCYTTSARFKVMIAEASVKGNIVWSNMAAARRGTTQIKEKEELRVACQCLECGMEMLRKRSTIPRSGRIFCSRVCYRAYMAKRFDRWIASPQSIALPQNYDEFLGQDELPCLVEGCNWRGKCLSTHVNHAHGITAEEFKRLAGFNRKSGLITADIAAIFAARQRELLENRPDIAAGFLSCSPNPSSRHDDHGKRNEAHEHRMKALALTQAEHDQNPPPEVRCRACGTLFVPACHGRKLYCTTKCRDSYYLRRDALARFPMECAHCGVRFYGNKNKARRFERSLPVCCSMQCRNARNIVFALAARGKTLKEPLGAAMRPA